MLGLDAKARHMISNRAETAVTRGAYICAGRPISKELRDQTAALVEISQRIGRKRRSIRDAFDEAGVSFAMELAAASAATIRQFLDASDEAIPPRTRAHSLARALNLEPSAIESGLCIELSEKQRFYLHVQLDRLEALSRELEPSEPNLFAAR